jgi:hypothetical protein
MAVQVRDQGSKRGGLERLSAAKINVLSKTQAQFLP